MKKEEEGERIRVQENTWASPVGTKDTSVEMWPVFGIENELFLFFPQHFQENLLGKINWV